jgi:hypothetical protein
LEPDQNKIDEHFLLAIKAAGDHGDNELITGALIIYTSINADEEGLQSYGQISYHGAMPAHEVVGLLEMAKQTVLFNTFHAGYEDDDE